MLGLHIKPVISVEDLSPHNWAISFKTACAYFFKCDLGAKAFLLNHNRAGVRSAALISSRNGPDKHLPCWLMPKPYPSVIEYDAASQKWAEIVAIFAIRKSTRADT